ncbi:hypothetical protein BaRGS_00026615 [Batillaria attramentaria]|uniref:Uncharacterized protein n=1 Tax=Batillaria attramentaria TaxID=370345 RepID=A0ABD0K424_9CAEN
MEEDAAQPPNEGPAQGPEDQLAVPALQPPCPTLVHRRGRAPLLLGKGPQHPGLIQFSSASRSHISDPVAVVIGPERHKQAP